MTESVTLARLMAMDTQLACMIAKSDDLKARVGKLQAELLARAATDKLIELVEQERRSLNNE